MDMAGVKNRSYKCPRALAKGDGCQRSLGSWHTSAAAPPFLLSIVRGGSEGRSHGFHGEVGWGRQQVQREREGPKLGLDCGLWVGAQVSGGAQRRGSRSLGGAVLGGASEDMELIALSSALREAWGWRGRGMKAKRRNIQTAVWGAAS